MWPQRYQLGSFAFTAYDVMRVVAIAAATGLTIALNREQGIRPRVTLAIAVCCAPLAVLAAWLLDAIEYAPSLRAIDAELARGGSSIYGALFATGLVVWILTAAWRIPTLRFLDAGAPALALGEGVSRIGCFLAGCCYGKPWDGPWAVTFPHGSYAIGDLWQRGAIDPFARHAPSMHPVQLYGVALMLLLTVLLIRRFRQPRAGGEVLFLFLIGYGAYRLAIVPFRVEALASMKVFSLVFIAAGVLGLLWSRVRMPRPLRAAGVSS